MKVCFAYKQIRNFFLTPCGLNECEIVQIEHRDDDENELTYGDEEGDDEEEDLEDDDFLDGEDSVDDNKAQKKVQSNQESTKVKKGTIIMNVPVKKEYVPSLEKEVRYIA